MRIILTKEFEDEQTNYYKTRHGIVTPNESVLDSGSNLVLSHPHPPLSFLNSFSRGSHV